MSTNKNALLPIPVFDVDEEADKKEEQEDISYCSENGVSLTEEENLVELLKGSYEQEFRRDSNWKRAYDEMAMAELNAESYLDNINKIKQESNLTGQMQSELKDLEAKDEVKEYYSKRDSFLKIDDELRSGLPIEAMVERARKTINKMAVSKESENRNASEISSLMLSPKSILGKFKSVLDKKQKSHPIPKSKMEEFEQADLEKSKIKNKH